MSETRRYPSSPKSELLGSEVEQGQAERGDSHVRDAEGIEEARAQNRPQTVEQHVAQIPALVVRGCWLGKGNLIGNIIIGT